MTQEIKGDFPRGTWQRSAKEHGKPFYGAPSDPSEIERLKNIIDAKRAEHPGAETVIKPTIPVEVLGDVATSQVVDQDRQNTV